MISTVKSVKPTGKEPFLNKHNSLLYGFYYTMEDGTNLLANHQTQASPFNAGDQVEYTITQTNAHGNIGKVGKPKDSPLHTPEPMRQISNETNHRAQTQLDRMESILKRIEDHLMPPF